MWHCCRRGDRVRCARPYLLPCPLQSLPQSCLTHSVCSQLHSRYAPKPLPRYLLHGYLRRWCCMHQAATKLRSVRAATLRRMCAHPCVKSLKHSYWILFWDYSRTDKTSRQTLRSIKTTYHIVFLVNPTVTKLVKIIPDIFIRTEGLLALSQWLGPCWDRRVQFTL